MKILETLYDNPPKSRLFIPRKMLISEKKSILCGARFSGKSSIIIDYLSKYKKEDYLYIDLADIRVNLSSNTINLLQDFINKKNIKVLVLENFSNECQIPFVNEVIISSIKPLYIDGFVTNFIYPLDFEEFMLFEKKYSNIEQVFNTFTNIGTYPSVVLSKEEEKYRNIQIMLKTTLLNKNILEALKILSYFQSSKISILQIYGLLKENIKISKDVLYASISNFCDESLIFLVEKYQQPNAKKKLYFIDFILNNALNFEKDFIKRFENMVFSELVKKRVEFFYTSMIDFYIPSTNTATICIPFLPPELIKRRFLKILKELKFLHVKELFVITVGNEGHFKSEGIKCEILPFWQWAII